MPKKSVDHIIESILNQSWEYAEADTQTLTHNLHRYSGKFIPQIAERAITTLSKPGELILDPYCGSGTTPLECALTGRRCIGVDLSPLAVLIAKTKTTPIPHRELASLKQTIRNEIEKRTASVQPGLFEAVSEELLKQVEADPRLSEAWYMKWFQPKVLRELVVIHQSVEALPNSALQNVALVAFSDILRRSSNAHSGYPNVMYDKNAPEKSSALAPYLRSLEKICAMVSTLNDVEGVWTGVEIRHGNACQLTIEDETIDSVISHPPYIGSIPYAEYGSLSLSWLGHDPKKLDSELTGGRRQSATVVSRFKDGYAGMIAEAARVLKAGRNMFLMVGNPVVRGELIDLADMTIELANQSGFELLTRTTRSGVNRRANKMGAEHLLFFSKKTGFGRPQKKRKKAGMQ